jgi:hypothetical protein
MFAAHATNPFPNLGNYNGTLIVAHTRHHTRQVTVLLLVLLGVVSDTARMLRQTRTASALRWHATLHCLGRPMPSVVRYQAHIMVFSRVVRIVYMALTTLQTSTYVLVALHFLTPTDDSMRAWVG